jgi:hypothetical protein
MADTLVAGGAGKNGTLAINNATGAPVLDVGVGGPNPRVPTVQLRLGAKELPAFVALEDGEGDRTASIDGKNGSLTLGGRSRNGGNGSSGSISLLDGDGSNTVQINAGFGEDGPELFLGDVKKPARIQIVTGGNPGPTIEIDGRKNALLFQKAGSNTDNIVEVNGAGSLRVGGFGVTGTIAVRSGPATDTFVELSGTGVIRAGGTGRNGTVSVRGDDGKPLVELLAGPKEGAIGVGQADRPGRISLFGAKGEAIRIDAASGDVLLMNADCAEEFDVAEAVEPGTVMVLTDDGTLAMSSGAYDTRVAGIVSGAGTYKPALLLDRRDTGKTRLPIALIGKVFCRVDASHGVVRVGDLLTSAERPGHAMRIGDPARAFGAVIGKALAPLAADIGLIPVLVSLQ